MLNILLTTGTKKKNIYHHTIFVENILFMVPRINKIVVNCTVQPAMSSHCNEQPTSYGRALGHSRKWHFYKWTFYEQPPALKGHFSCSQGWLLIADFTVLTLKQVFESDDTSFHHIQPWSHTVYMYVLTKEQVFEKYKVYCSCCCYSKPWSHKYVIKACRSRSKRHTFQTLRTIILVILVLNRQCWIDMFKTFLFCQCLRSSFVLYGYLRHVQHYLDITHIFNFF